MRNLRKKDGVTLISLIVVIIVLIMLAGITVRSIKSEDDKTIVNEALKTRKNYTRAQEKEILSTILVDLKNKNLEKMSSQDKINYIKDEAKKAGIEKIEVTNEKIKIFKREYTYQELINANNLNDIK